MNYNKQMVPNYQKSYDVFIRRAVLSDDEDYNEKEQNVNGVKADFVGY